MQTIAGLLVHKTSMKEYTFERFLEERFAPQYHGADDDMEDAFEVWLSRLDVQEVMDYAERWGTELKHVYSFNVISEILNKK